MGRRHLWDWRRGVYRGYILKARINGVNTLAFFEITYQVFGTKPRRLWTIEDKIKLQKVIYIVQETLGINIGAEYTMYLYGPYAPNLTDLYYDDALMLVWLIYAIRRKPGKKPRKAIRHFLLDTDWLGESEAFEPISH